MKRLLLFCTLLSVLALSLSSLHGNQRYGGQQSRNSLNYRGNNNHNNNNNRGYSSGIRSPGLPHGPSSPRAPSLPQAPRGVHGPGGPIQSYGSSRNSGGGGYNSRQSAPSPYGGGARHYGSSGPSVNQYQGAQSYGAGPLSYGGHGPVPFGGQAHASSGSSHYSSAKRSVYDPPPQTYGSSTSSRSSYPSQTYAQSQQHTQTSNTAHGREMKYTIRDPQNRGTTHVTETHVVSNKQMHGAEAEAAMKKLMGSMGPSSNGGFDDFLKGMGLPFY